MSHHGSRQNELDDLFSNDFLKLGATGKFPDGKLNEQDDGEIQYAMTILNGRLIMNFGKPITWIGLEKKQVAELIDYFQEKIKEM